MEFKQRKTPLKESVHINSKYLRCTPIPADHRLNIQSKKNSVWKNAKGRFNQMVILTKPIKSLLLEVQLKYLNFASRNVEIVLLNDLGFDFWMKRIKNSNEEDFTDIPSITKLDFGLRNSNAIQKFCKEHFSVQSLEKSIQGCQRVIKECTLMCNIDRDQEQMVLLKPNTEVLDQRDLTPKNEIKKIGIAFNFGGDSVKTQSIQDEEGDYISEKDDEWEDISEESTDNEETYEKISPSERPQMMRTSSSDSYYLGFILLNEHVEISIRFHQFQWEKKQK